MLASAKRLWRDYRVLAILMLVETAANLPYALVFPFFPLEAYKRKVPPWLSGLVVGSYSVSVPLSAFVNDRIVNWLGARKAMLSGVMGTAAFSLLFAANTNVDDLWKFSGGALFLRLMQTFCDQLSDISANTFAMGYYAPDRIGLATGYLTYSLVLSYVLALPLGGLLYDWGGFALPFIAATCLLLVVFACGALFLPADGARLNDGIEEGEPDEAGHAPVSKKPSLAAVEDHRRCSAACEEGEMIANYGSQQSTAADSAAPVEQKSRRQCAGMLTLFCVPQLAPAIFNIFCSSLGQGYFQIFSPYLEVLHPGLTSKHVGFIYFAASAVSVIVAAVCSPLIDAGYSKHFLVAGPCVWIVSLTLIGPFSSYVMKHIAITVLASTAVGGAMTLSYIPRMYYLEKACIRLAGFEPTSALCSAVASFNLCVSFTLIGAGSVACGLLQQFAGFLTVTIGYVAMYIVSIVVTVLFLKPL